MAKIEGQKDLINLNNLGELHDYLSQLIIIHGRELPVMVTEENAPNILKEICDISYTDSLVNGKFIHIEL